VYERPSQIAEWFAIRGYTLTVREEEGHFLADVTNAMTGALAAGYGRGRTPIEASERAKKRYSRALARDPWGTNLP
jgi:hypothetical protein